MRKNKNILLADNKMLHPFLLQRILTDEGYVCHMANTERQIHYMIHRNRYQLILLDFSFPGIRGLDVLRMLKDDPASRNIPVLVLSNREVFSGKQEVIKEGAADYITRPFNIQDLLNKISLLLPAA